MRTNNNQFDSNAWGAGYGGSPFEGVRRQRRGPDGDPEGGREGGRRRGRGHGPHGRGEWGGRPGDQSFGPPPWVTQMFGPQWGGGPGGGRGGRRTRVRRGDVRPAILDVLGAAGEPLNGYQVIQQIAERTQGVWKPSPGSVYPTIAQLVDEGFVEDAPAGRKTLQLTDAGRSYLADNADQVAAVWSPFDEDGSEEGHADLRQVIKQTVGAIVQVASAGTPAQQAKAVEILADTRRKLYGLLAEGPESAEEE
ncbi:PadR family transcriptional regulator [Nocardioides marmoriginsengisoli]|uniref:PadR family transcriptional regulator n=1 Tax=Nocardioides marmoriginsengisoli TaxID=661483 RepID=A0A3N0CJV7_9ACTN|nr:PadR family transcriptional regulator [Nocardioides marmoriginsengisoli]RNL63722.1 PadR family transcriptional regulator [Nocardioides marmoriginsengisoli]